MLRAAVQNERATETMIDRAPFLGKEGFIDLVEGTGKTNVRPIAMKAERNEAINNSEFMISGFTD